VKIENNRHFSSGCILVALAISSASYANGMTDVYVSPDRDDATGIGNKNDPFETVGKWIDTVGSGGTVNLGAGTYAQDNGLEL